MKEAKIKSLINKESLSAELAFLKAQNLKFTLSLSNYTTSIECEIPDFNKTYIAAPADVKTFVAYAMIKKDLTTWSANENPNIKPTDVNYFSQKKDIKTGYFETMQNVDIKAAYASVLLRYYFIQKETYDYIMTLPKINRLAAVGMTAARKTIYKYEGSKIISSHKEINPLEGYFYFCVKEIEKLMNYLELCLDETFVFSWVDGIYFTDYKKTKYVQIDIEQYGLQCTSQNLTEFNIKRKQQTTELTFYDEKKEYKIFNLPLPQNSFNKDILTYYNLI